MNIENIRNQELVERALNSPYLPATYNEYFPVEWLDVLEYLVTTRNAARATGNAPLAELLEVEIGIWQTNLQQLFQGALGGSKPQYITVVHSALKQVIGLCDQFWESYSEPVDTAGQAQDIAEKDKQDEQQTIAEAANGKHTKPEPLVSHAKGAYVPYETALANLAATFDVPVGWKGIGPENENFHNGWVAGAVGTLSTTYNRDWTSVRADLEKAVRAQLAKQS